MDNYLTVSQFVDSCKGKWPHSEGTVRALIFDADREKNEFQKAFLRIGRRVLVDPVAFWDCVRGVQS